MVREYLGDVLGATKSAAGVAAATIGSGVGLVLSLIPDDIGKAATAVGLVLSLVLIYTHWRNGRAEYQKKQLEILLLQRELTPKRRAGDDPLADDPAGEFVARPSNSKPVPD